MMVDIGQKRASMGQRSFWRRLVGTALVYALIMQPLALAIGGAQLADASAIDEFSLSQLCVHATDGSPLSPAGPQQPPADDHCVFCFAGAFHLLDAPRPAVVQHVNSEIKKARHSAHSLSLSSFSRYSVARPRGPPFSA
jgi:hypothetical protein